VSGKTFWPALVFVVLLLGADAVDHPSPATDDSVPVGSGTTWVSKTLPSCSAAAQMLQYNTGTNAFACGTGSAAITTTVTTATGTITTTSATPVLATGMTVTPAAGTYLVFFTGAVYQGTTGAGLYVELSIYMDGTQLGESRIQDADSTTFQTPFTCVGVTTVNGAQTIEGRWLRTAGSGTASMLGTRTLTIVKIG